MGLHVKSGTSMSIQTMFSSRSGVLCYSSTVELTIIVQIINLKKQELRVDSFMLVLSLKIFFQTPGLNRRWR